MFKVPCPECAAAALCALEDDKMLATPAGLLSGFCSHEQVMWTLAADRGLVFDWSVQPCASRERFAALHADSREAFARQALDAVRVPPGGAKH
jgi:hypothetical protein